jgi:hypothetical protein
VFLTFIHVPDDGSAEPKHAVYWHSLGAEWCSVQNKYILCCVRLCLLSLQLNKLVVYVQHVSTNRDHPQNGVHYGSTTGIAKAYITLYMTIKYKVYTRIWYGQQKLFLCALVVTGPRKPITHRYILLRQCVLYFLYLRLIYFWWFHMLSTHSYCKIFSLKCHFIFIDAPLSYTNPCLTNAVQFW